VKRCSLPCPPLLKGYGMAFPMTSLNKPTLILLALLLGPLCFGAKRPNLIIFMLDDVGYGDIGDYDRIGMGARFFDSAPKRPRSVFGRPAPVTPPVRNKPFAPLGDLRFDFESGDLQGRRLVEGAFSQPVSSALSLPSWQKDPFDRQGKFHLSTISTKDGAGVSDAQVGIIESPRFRLTGDRVAFLIGGGFRDDVHLAICEEAGKEIARSGGTNGPRMARRVIRLPKHQNQILFLRIVDRATKRWGHIVFDDFSAKGEPLDKK
jgi:hypothetical protein